MCPLAPLSRGERLAVRALDALMRAFLWRWLVPLPPPGGSACRRFVGTPGAARGEDGLVWTSP